MVFPVQSADAQQTVTFTSTMTHSVPKYGQNTANTTTDKTAYSREQESRMAIVIDYSAGFPDAATIAGSAFNIVGAMRYIGFPDRHKCTNASELARFTEHDLGMGAVFEDTAGRWRLGSKAGSIDGERAREHATQIEFPAYRPIYVAIDQDVVSSTEFSVMGEYVDAFRAQVGATGVYGENDVIEYCFTHGLTLFHWQTSAWSHRLLNPHRNLYQTLQRITVSDIDCDVNAVLTNDWGQHNWKGTDMDWHQEVTLPSWVNPTYTEVHEYGVAIGAIFFSSIDTWRALYTLNEKGEAVSRLDVLEAKLDALVKKLGA
jgi:hypothetical protein